MKITVSVPAFSGTRLSTKHSPHGVRVRVQPRGGLNLLRLFSVAAPAFALMFSFFMKREWNAALKTALIILR